MAYATVVAVPIWHRALVCNAPGAVQCRIVKGRQAFVA